MPTLLLKMPPTSDDSDHRVRAILCSAIPPSRHRELEKRWNVPWFELYGMTESGIDIRVRTCDHANAVGTSCIGGSGLGRTAAILGDNLVPLAAGTVGELVLRGRSLMKGYLHDPRSTAEVVDADGWLHTGDLAWMDTRSNIYFAGRKKQMIRRAGENVSAAQIEEALLRHPHVAQAACVPVSDELRGEEIFAFVQAVGTGATSFKTLAEYARGHLATFKVPRFWLNVDTMPTTPSQRVAKKSLVEQHVAVDRVYDSTLHRWVSNPLKAE